MEATVHGHPLVLTRAALTVRIFSGAQNKLDDQSTREPNILLSISQFIFHPSGKIREIEIRRIFDSGGRSLASLRRCVKERQPQAKRDKRQ